MAEVMTVFKLQEIVATCDFAVAVQGLGDQVTQLLTEKNAKYGNSALEPLRLFSKADPVEQLKVRIDDKLSRIRTLSFDSADGEDVLLDLEGYVRLLRLALITERKARG